MKAGELYIGCRYWSGGTVQEVTVIEYVRLGVIVYRTKRIYPDKYDGYFYQRKFVDTVLKKYKD